MRIEVSVIIKPKENFNINTIIEYLKKELNIIGWDIEENTFKYKTKVEGFKQSDLWYSFEYVIFKVSDKYDFLPVSNEGMALNAINIVANETNLFKVEIRSFNCI